MGAVENTVNTYTSPDSEKYYGTSLKTPWTDAESAPLHWSKESQRYITQEVVEYAEKYYKEQLKTKLDYPWKQANGYTSWGQGVVGTLQSVIDKANETTKALSKSTNVEAPSYEGSPTNPSKTPTTGGGGVWLYDDPKTTALQNFLNANWNTYVLQATGSSQLGVDGDYGPNTQKAVKAVQEKLGVSQSGKWDSATVEAMKRYYSNQESAMRRAGMTSSVQDYIRRRAAIPAAFIISSIDVFVIAL